MQRMCGGVWNDRKPRKTTTKFKQEIEVMNRGCMGRTEGSMIGVQKSVERLCGG